jgi:hypothetical protein
LGAAQLFLIQLSAVMATVASGARLMIDQTVCTLEPLGVFQFANKSRQIQVSVADFSGTPVMVNIYYAALTLLKSTPSKVVCFQY